VQELGLDFLDPLGLNSSSPESAVGDKSLKQQVEPVSVIHQVPGHQTASELMNQLREAKDDEDAVLAPKPIQEGSRAAGHAPVDASHSHGARQAGPEQGKVSIKDTIEP